MRFTPKGYKERHHYQMLVITNDNTEGALSNVPCELPRPYVVGQIIICDVTGGIPIEVGTHTKPGRLDYTSKSFDVMDQAIEFSYMITDSGWDKKTPAQKTKLKKQMFRRHKKRVSM